MRSPPDLGRPPDIPPKALAMAMALVETGRLHRYSESGGDGGLVAALERDFARMMGRRYAVALNSCGSALFLALKTAGVVPGDKVLLNAFTLGPVPGAVQHVGARPVLVEITEDLVIDFDDLRAKARASGARVLLLSHMRGHLCDLGALAELCREEGITLIEDCAHTLGATWAGWQAGNFGLAGCFSFQSGKHVNTGEGGILITDDDDVAAQAILHAGSYRLYRQNGTCPPEQVMVDWFDRCGNYSLRMSALVAALALPQLPLLPKRVADWNASHDRIAQRLQAATGFVLPHRPQAEAYAQSSLQFRLPARDKTAMASFIDAARARGVWVKWFGSASPEGYSSNPGQWPGAQATEVPRACAIQTTLCDIRLPLELSAQDCELIADALIQAAEATDDEKVRCAKA
ncbi:MAG: aminotransferase class I/II-fold pyridoxal phosphate-dependent enzyme [Rhodobacteraceae bacterium]|nr:MAG: aminotransferase class I/II-fold pyridoxal phosphate-dependent enzyme [Paracoccaceae bacterium]